MMKIPVLSKRFLCLLLLNAGMLLLQKTVAQDKANDLELAYKHFWTDYASVLKKIKNEKDNGKAALLVDQMGKDILPRFSQLVKQSSEWKKNHSASELKKMEEWVEGNPYAEEVSNLQTELMLRSGKEAGALGKSFSAYMRSMAGAGKGK